jgi:hypothetical protein
MDTSQMLKNLIKLINDHKINISYRNDTLAEHLNEWNSLNGGELIDLLELGEREFYKKQTGATDEELDLYTNIRTNWDGLCFGKNRQGKKCKLWGIGFDYTIRKLKYLPTDLSKLEDLDSIFYCEYHQGQSKVKKENL